MNKRHTKKIENYRNVRLLFEDKKTSFESAIPGFKDKQSEYNENMIVLEDNLVQAGADTKIYYRQKKEVKLEITSEIVRYVTLVSLFAAEDEKFAEYLTLTKSKLARYIENEFSRKCHKIMEICKPYNKQLPAVGFTLERIDKLKKLIKKYKDIIPESSDKRQIKSANINRALEVMAELEKKLKRFDIYTLSCLAELPELNKAYWEARKGKKE